MKIDQLDRCARVLEDALRIHRKQFDLDVSAEENAIPIDDRDDWYDWMADRRWELSDVFPGTLRRSLFLSAYSLFEHGLDLLAHTLHRSVPKDKALADFKKDKGIERARKYLKQVQKVDFPDQSREWNDLMKWRTVRNYLAHRDGRVGPSDKTTRLFLKANGLGTVDRFGRITLMPKAVQHLVVACRKLLMTAYTRADARVRELSENEGRATS